MTAVTKILQAASHVDWKQVALHGGDAPCFHVCDDGRFCLRTLMWPGHQSGKRDHLFEPVAVAFTRVAQSVHEEPR